MNHERHDTKRAQTTEREMHHRRAGFLTARDESRANNENKKVKEKERTREKGGEREREREGNKRER